MSIYISPIRLIVINPIDFGNKIMHILQNSQVTCQSGHNSRNVTFTIHNWKRLNYRLEGFLTHILCNEEKSWAQRQV